MLLVSPFAVPLDPLGVRSNLLEEGLSADRIDDDDRARNRRVALGELHSQFNSCSVRYVTVPGALLERNAVAPADALPARGRQFVSTPVNICMRSSQVRTKKNE